MKILNYKKFKIMNLVKEEVFNVELPPDTSTEEILQGILKTKTELKNFEEQIGNFQDVNLNDVLEFLDESPLPKSMKEYTKTLYILLWNEEWRLNYHKLLDMIKKKLDDGLSPYKINEDPEVKSLSNMIEKQMSKILNLSKEELTEITNKFFGGLKKYRDLKQDSIKIVEEDPYGEEEWDDMSDEERLKKAFEQFANESSKDDDYYFKGALPISINYHDVVREFDSLKAIENELIFNCQLSKLIQYIDEQHIPEKLKEYHKMYSKLLYNEKFLETLHEFLMLNKMALQQGGNKLSDTDLEDLKSYRDILDNLIEKILNIKIEVFNELSDWFIEKYKNFKKEQDSSRVFSIEDPYGEEEWDDNPYRAFEKFIHRF